jgi:AmmeMemoRadiSam system protein A
MWLPEYPRKEPRLTHRDGLALLDLAEASIRHGLRQGSPPAVGTSDLADALRQPRSTFVTLRLGSALRGCIGSVKPKRSLAEDVSHNAYSAAFHDPRFSPLGPAEYPELSIHLSVLSDLLAVDFTSQADLLSQVRKNRDGLLLEIGPHRGLLLPSVWKDLPEKEQFLQHLKMKAGLQPDFWSNLLKIQRFTTQTFSRRRVGQCHFRNAEHRGEKKK